MLQLPALLLLVKQVASLLLPLIRQQAAKKCLTLVAAASLLFLLLLPLPLLLLLALPLPLPSIKWNAAARVLHAGYDLAPGLR